MSSDITAQLIMIQGDQANFQRIIDLRSNNVSIGRAQTCNIIWGSLQISRKHATLEYVTLKWFIRDTSTNGLSVNGSKLVKGELFQLKDADIISFIPTGAVRYRFRYGSPNASPCRPMPAIGHSSTISPQPSASRTATPSSSRPATLANRIVDSLESLPFHNDNNLSDAEDNNSNHSESLLSLGNGEDFFLSFSGDERRSSSAQSEDETPNFSISKRKHASDSSDSDSGSLDRKKKRTQLSSSDDDEDSLNSVSEKSETNFKTRRLNGCKLMSEDQINKCDDLKAMKLQLKSCLAKLGSAEVELKTLEIERNMEREDFRRKENDVQSVNAAFKEETYKKILELLESELSCAVCNEVFIQATVVDCGHTFCSFCINEWARKKQECPICRKAFRNRSRHIEMENYISRLFDSFTTEIAARRKASIKDREEQAKKAAEDAARAATENQNRGGGNFQAFIQTTAERYVDFLAELHQINEILSPRSNPRANATGDRRRSARIQERVVDGAVVGQAQPAGRNRRGRGNNRNATGNEANNNGTGAVAVVPPPIPPRGQPTGGSSRQNGNNIPVVTLNDSNDDGAAAANAPHRFPNQFINCKRRDNYIIPVQCADIRRLPIPPISLIDIQGRNRDGSR